VNGFVNATEIGPGLSQEQEHEQQIKYLLDINEKLNEALDAKPESTGSMPPHEKQALLEIINDLQTGLKLCNQTIEKQAIQIKDLNKEVSDATQAIIEIREHFPALIASINKRVSKVEHPDKQPGQTAQDRAKRIDKYMEGRPDHKASYEALKGFLLVNDVLLNFALAALKKECPDKYVMIKDKLDRRKKWLMEVPKI
jgi:ElaB/YqjD/DUF883 family membrane-anchored ribosome-binding protein